MAGSVTVSRIGVHRDAPVERIRIDWTADGNGAVSGTKVYNVAGVITRVTTVPAAGGNAPDDNYDVTLLDDEGVDLLAGLGANRDTANTESVAPMLGAGTNVPVVVAGSIELNVAAAGAANKGAVVLYLDRR